MLLVVAAFLDEDHEASHAVRPVGFDFFFWLFAGCELDGAVLFLGRPTVDTLLLLLLVPLLVVLLSPERFAFVALLLFVDFPLFRPDGEATACFFGDGHLTDAVAF